MFSLHLTHPLIYVTCLSHWCLTCLPLIDLPILSHSYCRGEHFVSSQSQPMLFVLLKLLFQGPKQNEYIHFLVISHEYCSFARLRITLKTLSKFHHSDKTKSLFYYLLLDSNFSSQYLFWCFKLMSVSDLHIFLIFYVYLLLEVFCKLNEGMFEFLLSYSFLGEFLFSTMCMDSLFIGF